MAIIQTKRGAKVQYGGETMKVVAAKGFDSLTLQSKSGEFFDALITQIIDEAAGKPPQRIAVDSKREAKLDAYLRAFGPLLKKDRLTKQEVKDAGAKVGIGVSAAYEALGRYRNTGKAADLPPRSRPGGRGKPRINAKAETIIQDEIEKTLLNRRNYPIGKFLKSASARLAGKGLTVSEFTLRARVAAIPDYKWIRSRRGYEYARQTREPHEGETPPTNRPLEIIQGDHWTADVEILSDDRLSVIGRPWATIAIDVYSRVVWGMHIGLDAPGNTPFAMCMINGMTRKEATLEALGISGEMPIYGDPERLLLDNAGEFRGNSIQASCDHFGINLKWRPVREPQYGAYIERLNGTLAEKLKEFPGATGASVEERKKLRPETTAALTLGDLTTQLWSLVNEYHNTEHSGLGGKTPLEKWMEYFFGPDGPRHSLPPVRVDDLDLRINWYPLEPRTIQRYGFVIDYLEYYCDDIKQLARNYKDYKKKKYRFMVRRNPFNVKEIFVLHPERNEWIRVPTRHFSFPVASIFELKAVKKVARAKRLQPTPAHLAKLIEERHAHLERAEKLTKTAQREAARLTHHRQIRAASPHKPQSPADAQDFQADFVAKPAATPPSAKSPPRPRSPSAGTANVSTEELKAMLAEISDASVEDMIDD